MTLQKLRSFWSILDDFNIFVKMPYPLVKFKEKQDSDIGETNHSRVTPKFWA